MIEYDGSKCTPHSQTRCSICAAQAFKGKKPIIPASPPPDIAGGPPADIEGLSVRARLPQTAEEVNTEYDKILAEVNEMKASKQEPDLGGPIEGTGPVALTKRAFYPGGQSLFVRDTFSTLPVDDSHASKVLRAAAKFSSAVQSWAQELAYVEKIKKALMEAEVALNKASFEKNNAEEGLNSLTRQ